MKNNGNIVHIRREILVRIIQAYLSDNFEDNVDKIPFEMRPKNSEVPYRCCVHKERAILRKRTIAGLGLAIENDDEATHLAEYARISKRGIEKDNKVLTVIDTACKGCVPNRIVVTDICQGCVARPCANSCPFGAISVQAGKSVIDYSKCKSCTKCVQVCPYKAIVKLCVPCEDACPVSAIKKDESGFAQINFDKCINCGQCISSCPFGAVHEKSQIIDILKAIKEGKKVTAMLAPSVVGQLPCSINQIAEGLIQSGFSKVVEVAVGADLTAKHEAHEFEEKISSGSSFMTTSCCKAYTEAVKKHIPELKDYISETGTPMHYTAEIEKKELPDSLTVFIGPCVAKRIEGIEDKNVDFVMSFEEMGALFVALRIELSSCKPKGFAQEASKEARSFGVSGGVMESVKAASGKNSKLIKPVYVKGLDKVAIRNLKSYAKNNSCPEGNLIEVMACTEGCIGGPCVINYPKISSNEIKKYSENSTPINPD